MEIFPLIFGATFGIGVIVGMLHLVIGLSRPRSPVHLLFVPVAIGFALQALCVHVMSQTTSLAQYVAVYRYGYGVTGTISMVAFAWFVSFYTNVRRDRFVLFLSLYLIVLFLVPQIILPLGIFTETVTIRRASLPWGGQITLHQGGAIPWLSLGILWLLMLYGFFAYALFQQWRRGERRRALLLGFPLLLFALGTVFSRLTDAGIVDVPYLGGAAVIAVAVPLSLDLAHSSVRTRQALRKREQQLSAFVTHTEEGIWTVVSTPPLPLGLSVEEQGARIRNAGRFSSSNDAMAHILGYNSREELIGREFSDIFAFPPEENEGVPEGLGSTGFPASGLVTPALDREGQIKYLEGSFTPIVEDGHVVQIWGTSRDVTERLRMTEELRRYRDELGALVEARTAQLEQANEQLSLEVAERKQAEKAVQESRRFIRSILDSLPYQVVVLDESGTILEVNRAWSTAADENALTWESYGIGRNYLEVVERAVEAGAGAEAESAAKGIRAVLTGDPDDFKLEYPCHGPDEQRWFIMRVTRFVTEEARAVVTHEDITARRRIELELEQRLQELSALHEIAVVLATLSDLPRGLPQVAQQVTNLFQVDATYVILSESVDAELTVVGFERESGPLAPAPLGLTLPELPLTRQVLQEQRPLAATAGKRLETTAAARAFLESHHMASFVLLPLMVAGKVVGVMALSSKQVQRSFSPEEVRLAETIAADLAAAVSNLHLLERMQEAAALEERQRIASDLHDSVTQTIYSVGIMAQTVPRLLQEHKLAEAEQTVGQIRLRTLGALAELRTLLFELRPAALAEAGLGVLLQQVGDGLTGQLHVPVDLVVRGDVQPPVDVKIAFYRIAQEAFNNVAKHAKPTRVAVTLSGSEEVVELGIVDDGQGFDMSTEPTGRMGLRIMKERAEMIGARLHIESQPGEGTEIYLSWGKRDL